MNPATLQTWRKTVILSNIGPFKFYLSKLILRLMTAPVRGRHSARSRGPAPAIRAPKRPGWRLSCPAGPWAAVASEKVGGAPRP